MPQIIVTADGMDDVAVTLRERINVDDFDSERFAANLVERLGWAVIDAAEVEQTDGGQRRSIGGRTDGEAYGDRRQPDADERRSARLVTTAS